MKIFTLLACAGIVAAALCGCVENYGGNSNSSNDDLGNFKGGFSNTSVFPGSYEMEGSSYVSGKVLSPGPYKMKDGEVVYLQSEVDGVDIQIGIIKPEVPEGVKVPVIADAGPYFTPMQNNEVFQERIGRWAENFVPYGYAFALLPVRGSADSGGGSDLCGPWEASDLNQAVTWLGQQEWCNGNIGIIGKSYDGSTPWEVAATGNPYLKTIVPISGISDMYTLLFKNGTETRAPAVFHALYYMYGFGYDSSSGRSAKNTLEGIADVSFPLGVAASIYSTLAGERDPFGYWSERNYRPGVEKNYKGSILLVHGLQDWNVDPHNFYPWVPSLEEKGTTVKYMLGQWQHHHPDSMEIEGTEHMRWDWEEILLHWFDYWLKGNTSVDLGPKVQVEDSGGRWRNGDSWPPENCTSLKLYLSADGKILESPSSAEGSVTVGSSTFGFAAASFESAPLEEELRFAGSPSITLKITPQAPGGQMNALLYAVGGDSSKKRIGCGQVDIAFNGGEARQIVIPGTEMEVTIVLQPLDAVIARGEKLLVEIGGDSYEDHLNTMPLPADIKLGGEGNFIGLEAFEPDENDFFLPPGN